MFLVSDSLIGEVKDLIQSKVYELNKLHDVEGPLLPERVDELQRTSSRRLELETIHKNLPLPLATAKTPARWVTTMLY